MICGCMAVVAQNTNGTLPRALMSVYVGLETSSHHDGQDTFSEPTATSGTGLGICSRSVLLGSRILPFPALLRSWLLVIGGRGGMPSMVTSIIGILLSSRMTRSGWRSFSDERSAFWTRFRTTGSKCVLKTPCSSYWRTGSNTGVLDLDVRSCGGT